jgi:hypothetical protein
MFRSVAIVTGASRGIGHATEIRLARDFPLSRRRAHRRNAGGHGRKRAGRRRKTAGACARPMLIGSPCRGLHVIAFARPNSRPKLVGAPFRGVGEQW